MSYRSHALLVCTEGISCNIRQKIDAQKIACPSGFSVGRDHFYRFVWDWEKCDEIIRFLKDFANCTRQDDEESFQPELFKFMRIGESPVGDLEIISNDDMGEFDAYDIGFSFPDCDAVF